MDNQIKAVQTLKTISTVLNNLQGANSKKGATTQNQLHDASKEFEITNMTSSVDDSIMSSHIGSINVPHTSSGV